MEREEALEQFSIRLFWYAYPTKEDVPTPPEILQLSDIWIFFIVELFIKANNPFTFSVELIYIPDIEWFLPSNVPQKGILFSPSGPVEEFLYIPIGSHSSFMSSVMSLVRYTYFPLKELPEFTASLNFFKSSTELIAIASELDFVLPELSM